MTPSSIRLQEGSHDREALPACLEAVLQWAGAAVDYRSVYATLGLPFWIAAPRRARCLACWMSEGHDALLVEAARLFGVRLRELHPPEAAVGLEDSPEFTQHFEASYRPLMEIALDHGQPVLVRRGWPDACGNLWGLATHRGGGDFGFCGIAPGVAEHPAPLAAPPVQVYVVEEIAPRHPAPAELLAHVLEAARRIAENELDPRFGIVTGQAAYDAWLTRLKLDPICPHSGHDGAGCHQWLRRSVKTSRESACEFFGQYSNGATGLVERRQRACRAVIVALGRRRSVDEVAALLNSAEGRSELVNEVQLAKRHDRDE